MTDGALAVWCGLWLDPAAGALVYAALRRDAVNLYLVVSEPLETVVCEDFSVNACHREDYCITELVIARNRSQATYLAWQSDPASSNQDIREKPKFRTELKERGVQGLARIASREYSAEEHDGLWEFREEAEEE